MNFSTNKQTEVVKSPKIYFYDLGLRNASVGNFNLESSPNLGAVYENFIFCEFLRNGVVPKYWRTKSGAEVDFIVEKGYELIPVEIKETVRSDVVERGYRSFVEKYKVKKGFILSKSFISQRNIKECDVNFLTYANFLSEFQEIFKIV